MGEESHRDGWRSRNLSTVVLAVVRADKDPAFAWDVATETMAAAPLAWETFPGGSRMAWVLEHGRRVLRDARRSGRVSSRERARNGAAVAKTLSIEEQDALRVLAREPLGLDPDAAETADALAREAPPPGVLSEVALSRLTRCGRGSRSRERGGA